MNDIEKARDVLAKWREGSTPGVWSSMSGGVWTKWPRIVTPQQTLFEFASVKRPDDARLIVGTAGNPDLLNAIDALLLDAVQHGQYADADRIAAAIIAADERMQQ